MHRDPAHIALGTSPISPATPAGGSVRYDPGFDQLQSEIAKLGGLDGSQPSWPTVVEQASAILATKAKDLLVAAWLGGAWLETAGATGLAQGLLLIQDLTATFAEGLHPERVRARKGAFDWYLGRIAVWLETAPAPTADEREALTAAVVASDALLTWGDGKWDGEEPDLRGARRTIQARLDAIPSAVVESAAIVDGALATTASGAAVPASAPLKLTGTAGRDEAYRRLREIADFLVGAEPHSPVPFLITRAIAWGNMPFSQLYGELLNLGEDTRRYLLGQLGESPAAAAPKPAPVPAAVAVSAAPAKTPASPPPPAAAAAAAAAGGAGDAPRPRPRGDY